MTDDQANIAIKYLLDFPREISPATADQDYREMAPFYIQLCAAIQSYDTDGKQRCAAICETALSNSRNKTLGMYLLDAALFRSRISDYENWGKIGTGALVPKPQLLTLLDRRAEFAQRRGSPYGLLYEGVKHFVSGDDLGAFRLFSRAKENPLFWTIVRDDFRGAATCDDLAFQRLPSISPAALRRFPLPTGRLRWQIGSPSRREGCVIVFACDDVYFRAFAPFILSSLPADGAGLNLHFHVVNPSDLSVRVIGDLQNAAACRHIALTLSTEATPVEDRAYFACARFLRLHEFLAVFEAPVLLIDTDMEFVGDPRQWLRLLNPDAVNMLFVKGPWDSGFLPWRAIWGGLIYVPPTEEGHIFAVTLQGVIGRLWNPLAPTNWWIDQNALYIAYRMLQRYWGPAGFCDIGPEVHEQLRSSETLKIGRLNDLPQIAVLMQAGVEWLEALQQVQLGKG